MDHGFATSKEQQNNEQMYMCTLLLHMPVTVLVIHFLLSSNVYLEENFNCSNFKYSINVLQYMYLFAFSCIINKDILNCNFEETHYSKVTDSILQLHNIFCRFWKNVLETMEMRCFYSSGFHSKKIKHYSFKIVRYHPK